MFAALAHEDQIACAKVAAVAVEVFNMPFEHLLADAATLLVGLAAGIFLGQNPRQLERLTGAVVVANDDVVIAHRQPVARAIPNGAVASVVLVPSLV